MTNLKSTSAAVNSKLELSNWSREIAASSFRDLFGASIHFLSSNNFIHKITLAWVKSELLKKLTSGEVVDLDFNSEDAQKLLLSWASDQCNNQLETLYLAEKHHLDQVTCSILRVKDPCLALELYHRLKAKESTFERLSWKFGEGEEKKYGGKISNQKMSNIPLIFHSLIKKTSVGSVLKPHRIGDFYVILRLDQFKPAEFDDSMKNDLLRLEVNRWILSTQRQLLEDLELE